MFNVVSILTVALAASSVSAVVVPRKNAPKGWLTEVLEPYHEYHTRYLALTCQNFHGKAFFDLCCHPMLANETLEKNRDKSCVPSPAASSSASAAEPTSTITTPEDDEDEEDLEAEEEEDCEEEEEEATVAAAPATTYVTPTTVAPVNVAAEPTAESTKAVEVTSSKVAEPSSTQAPEPATTQAPEPTTSKAAPTTTKTSEAEPTPASGGETFSGHATFYFQDGVAGACGNVHGDDELIVAMDTRRYGNTGKKSDLCGKQVKITNTANGKSVVATVQDACPGCDSPDSIDLSEGTFTKIGEKDTGILPISWSFV